MEIDRIPPELLNGKSMHCQPVVNGSIIEAPIFPSEGLLPTAKVVIVCPARLPRSKCKLKVDAGDGESFCSWYRGDSLGEYQIIGPGMDKKSTTGYK